MLHMMKPIQKAIDILGGAMPAAQALGVSHQSVYFWMSGDRTVPAELCPDIELATGVTCEELRPDVNWSVLRCATQ
jgi:DNA-binding transcriptional regulator YdaS (Cro superfamily)